MHKARITFWCTSLAAVLVISGAQAFGQAPRIANPGFFQKVPVPVSSSFTFLASEQGKQLLLHSPNPNAKMVLRRFFGSAVANQWPMYPLLKPQTGVRPLPQGPTVAGCGTASGTEFNLEPASSPGSGPVPQNTPPVDFIPGFLTGGTANTDLVVQTGTDYRYFLYGLGAWDGSQNGIYVHRDATQACYGGTDFELGNPPIPDPLHAGQTMPDDGGLGRVVADATNSQFIFTDLRFNEETAGVGLLRVPAVNFTSTVKCPKGTENLAQAMTCVGTTAVLLGASEEDQADFENLTQDPRASGTGAGDIYVTWTDIDNDFTPTTQINLVACKAKFASIKDCSSPVVVSGSDTEVTYSGVSVVPGTGANAGKITVSYVNAGAFPYQGKMAVCTPKGAPVAPVCAAATLVATESQPVTSLADNAFRVNTIPVIANRADASGQTTFAVWAHCKTLSTAPLNPQACLDSDVVMKTSTNLGTSWSAVTTVDAGVGTHEFMPAISVDNTQSITNIAYYKTSDSLHYKNRTEVYLKQIPSGSTTPGAAIVVTTSPDSPAGDPNLSQYLVSYQYGDYIGISARSTAAAAGKGIAYIGFTNDSRLGTYGISPTVQNPESNNTVSRVTY